MNRYETDTLRYYNAGFTNTTGRAQLATLVDARTDAILANPSDWLMSVVRFDVDIRTIPINIPTLLNPNPVFPPLTFPGSYTTTSSITLKRLNVYYTQPVVYLETDRSAGGPTIYNYQNWLDFVNTALAAAFTASGAAGSPPLFIFDPITQLIDLYVDVNFIPGAPNLMEIYMNVPLYLYFTNFEAQHDTDPSNNTLYDLKLIITNSNTNLMPAIGARQDLPIAVQAAPATLYLCRQTSSGVGGWTSLRSLILTSTLLPCRSEAIPENTKQSANYNSQNIFPILTDFLVPVDRSPTDNRIVGEYLPTAQYRYIDLVSNTPLNTIDLAFYWTDFLGNKYPLYLNNGTGMNIKILFQKKNILHKK